MSDGIQGVTARQRLEAAGKLHGDTVAASVDGKVYDLHTPIPDGASSVEPIRASEPAALGIIRHSTAHVMADAVQRLFPGTKVAFGPAIDDGFYYDYDRPDGSFTEEDLEKITEVMLEIIEANAPFERRVVSHEDAKRLLEALGESYKLEHLERLKDDEISFYQHGKWVDLCEGPHVPSTGFLKAFKLTHRAGAYWRGDERNPMLQRIYGTAFPDAKSLRAYLLQRQEAEKRDHRKLGKELGLIAFHPYAPASPFFLPRGAQVYNRLVEYIRGLYDGTGYREVITPQVFDNALFHTSGHLPSYGENMFFAATVDGLEDASEALVKNPPKDEAACADALLEHLRFGIKPMNCPSHCLVFAMDMHSYRDLPLRIADFGRLHRYERSGVVQGLTRVRSFAQDDAHIFCTLDQVQGEIASFIDLVFRVYEDFGFSDTKVIVATRPDQRLGTDEVWDRAEEALCEACRAKGIAFDVAEGEGAFYGPKIEFHLKDAIGRSWQLGTIQADFNLPERFDLLYVGADNERHRPVMLHRAILGSVERFFGVLVEHVAGAFPIWLAPEQLRLLTVSERFNDYAEEVAAALRAKGHRVDVDGSADKLGAKIRNARNLRIPLLGVVGEREVESRGLSIRSRDENADLGFKPLEEVEAMLAAFAAPPSRRPG
jgi:threonyl-tRNA synthetase